MDEAREEIIARACEDMLKMSKVGKELFNSLSEAEQKTLVDKVKDIIQGIKDWVSKALGLYESDSYEASIFRQYQEELEKLSALWDEMLIESVVVNQALERSGAFGDKSGNNEVRFDERESLSDACDVLESISDEDYNRMKSKHPFVYVMDSTPQIVLDSMKNEASDFDLFVKDRRILIRRDALYLAIRENGVQEGHYHGLGAEALKKLPEYLEKPDAILKTDENEKRCLVLSHINAKNGQGIISVEFESSKDYEGHNDYFNVIITVFDLHENYIKKLFKKNNAEIKYEKEDLEQVNPQLYKWLRTFNSKSSKDSIRDFDKNVKMKFSERDNEYLELAKNPEQNKTRLNELVADAAKEKGYTERVYHGTAGFGFTKLDVSKSDDGISFFATDSIDLAQTYSGVKGETSIKKGNGQSIENKQTYDNAVSSFVDKTNNIAGRELLKSNELPFEKHLNKIKKGKMDINQISSEITNYTFEIINEIEKDKHLSAENDKLIWELSAEVESALYGMNGQAGNYGLYANTEGFLEIDGNGSKWSSIPFDKIASKTTANTREIVKWAKDNGYKGVLFKNIYDIGYHGKTQKTPANVYAFLNPQEQLKSADPVTYDALGRIIPLSKRFNAEKNDIRYSERDYSYDELVAKPDMKLTILDTNVPNNRADIVYEAKKNAAKVGTINTKDKTVSVFVDDIGKDIVIGTKGLQHGLRRLKTLQTDANSFATLKAGEIIKNSVRINEMTPKNENADSSYVLIGAARSVNGDLYIVQSVINQFSNELMSMDVLYAVNAKKENQPRSMRPGIQPPVTGSTISIADLLDYVNKYFPDVLPEDVLKHYGYDARPEGEIGKSVLFSDREDTGVYDIMGETERVKKENEKFKEEIERLRERLKIERQVTHGNYFNENQLGAVAGHLRNISNSNYDKVKLMKSLKDVYSFIAHSENLTWEEVFRKCYVIADDMLAEAKPQKTVDDYCKHVLKEIRHTKISLTDEQKREARNIFDKHWNRYFFGRVVITYT